MTIIVAGETARAANFSLGGYARKTNPEMEKRNVVYFPNTSRVNVPGTIGARGRGRSAVGAGIGPNSAVTTNTRCDF